MKSKNLLKWALVGALLAFTPIAMAITTSEIYMLNNQMGPVAKKVALGTLINTATDGSTLARGFVLRGSAAGVSEAHDANDSGKILVGDGTDVASVAVSGDVTLSSAGAVAIGASKVTSTMILDDTIVAADLAANSCTTSEILDATIVNGDLSASAGVDFSKLAGLTRGYILRGNSSGVVEAYDSNDSAKILMGDGTDLTSVAITGDVTSTNAGVFAIGASKVLTGMIADATITTADIAASAVTTAEIALDTIGAVDIAANAIGTSEILDATIATVDISATAAIELTKLAALARGSIISGQTAGNVMTALDAKTSGNILVGDGTDLASVAVSGDATLSAAGAVTVAAGAITEAKLGVPTADNGLFPSRTAKVVYDFAVQGGAVSTIALGATIPDKAVVSQCFYRVLTALASAGGTGTFAVQIEAANDVVTAVDADTVSGVVQAIPDYATKTDWVLTTAARTISIVIGTEALTQGKFVLFCDYYVGE